MNTVRGKTAIVTGGGKGIGFQTCRELLRRGAKTVAILSRANTINETSAIKLNEEFGAGRALFFSADLTEFDKFEVVFKSVVEALGGLDILINNAGIFDDVTWETEIQINFTAVVKSTLLAFDYMSTRKGGKGGTIVNVASVLGLITTGLCPVYTATKHAITSFTICLKDHFERTGVSVRVICPGASNTALNADFAKKCLDFVDKAQATRARLAWTVQPCENVARAIVELIEKGANGAIWISQASDPPIEVELPKYECIKD